MKYKLSINPQLGRKDKNIFKNLKFNVLTLNKN